ncbi:uncharacterized protein [Montipora foliosa]|uniref:uncharacterized protein n=1 Tax=Montipora foliosa TaxID=591990 RepID=UPI0035F17B4E
MSEGEVSEEQFRVLEGVVYFLDPKSPGSFSFLVGKERIRIPLKREHNSLDAFKRHIVEHAGLKTEAEKRGIGSSIDLKLCRLVKSAEGSKAFSINTQAQWNVERPLFVDSAVLQVGQATPLNALPRMSHLKPARKLNDQERESMLEWAANNGKAVRQRTVRQETTMFKAGTLPLNMYATSEQPTEKITMERTLGHVDAAGDLGCPVEVVESNRKRQEEENQKDTDDEQESEYDSESESELPATVDSDLEDEMTLLRAVTTRSGRTIRVTSKFF